MTIADLRRLTAEAAGEAVGGAADSEGTAEAEATEETTPDSDASSEGTSANGTEDEQDPEALEGTDVPDSYFGYQFPPELTPEQRVELLSELQKRDDTIGKLLRGREEGTAEEPDPEPEPPAEMTDEEILQALGLDPDNPFMEETAKAVVPLVRKQLQQENVIAQLIEMQELNAIDTSWRSTLASMEKEFGALPAEVTHDAVMEFAAEQGIASPVDAYWRIAGPGRAAVESLTAERTKKLLAEKAKSASVRPTGGNASEEAPLEAKTTKGATREAATRILRELGLGN